MENTTRHHPSRLRLRAFVITTLAICCGCVPIRVPDTPHLAGRVADKRSHKGIPNAILYYDRFPKKAVVTSANGDFDFPTIHRWRVAWLIPQFNNKWAWIPFRTLMVMAPDYQADELTIFQYHDDTNKVIYLRRERR